MRFTTPRLNYCKCLKIKGLEIGDAICILFVPSHLHCHKRSNKAMFSCCLMFLLQFFLASSCVSLLILNRKNRTCSLHFRCTSIESFCNEVFAVSGSYLSIAWMSKTRCHSKNNFHTFHTLILICWKHDALPKQMLW